MAGILESLTGEEKVLMQMFGLHLKRKEYSGENENKEGKLYYQKREKKKNSTRFIAYLRKKYNRNDFVHLKIDWIQTCLSIYLLVQLDLAPCIRWFRK